MFKRPTLRIMASLIAGYGLLWLPALFHVHYMQTWAGRTAALPLLAIYPLHALGIPGLLESNGGMWMELVCPYRVGLDIHHCLLASHHLAIECPDSQTQQTPLDLTRQAWRTRLEQPTAHTGHLQTTLDRRIT